LRLLDGAEGCAFEVATRFRSCAGAASVGFDTQRLVFDVGEVRFERGSQAGQRCIIDLLAE
jgi:hypothetical protein